MSTSTKFILIAFVCAILSGDTDTVTHFHGCKWIGGTGNEPHLFDISEIYSCDEGKIEIAGKMQETIEYGYVFSSQLGKPTGVPHPATDYDYRSEKWCPTPTPQDPNQKERCGDKPVICWDKKIATWDPDWQGYSCATPDHKGSPGEGVK